MCSDAVDKLFITSNAIKAERLIKFAVRKHSAKCLTIIHNSVLTRLNIDDAIVSQRLCLSSSQC